jgi:predicted Zn-ribbon and HTH transcriptional regulator
MRPSLNLLTDRRRHGRLARRRTSGPAPRPRGTESPTRARAMDVAEAEILRQDLLQPDVDLSRARRAGGPEDVAQYTCSCGYVFAADVSTSVACPHCASTQAW